MRAELIGVGTELLLGEILNTNAQFLARRLADLGVDVFLQTTVGDNRRRLTEALAAALGRAEVVITTGGLGPTMDDVTREAVSDVTGRPLRERPELVAELERIFARRSVPMSDNNRRQTQLPEGARALPNPVGTAPGIWLDLDGGTIICLPGPPREMVPMFEREVAPELRQRAAGRSGTPVALFRRRLRIVGLAESTIEDRLRDLVAGQRDPTIAPYAHHGEIHLRLATKARDEAEAAARFAPLEAEIARRLGHHLYGRDEQSLEQVVAEALRRAGRTLAVAESCTGGLIGHRLTNVPGSSEFFILGIVAYDNRAKESLLQVPAEVLARHGAVSPETARAMAEGVRRRAATDLGLAVTGIAGPSGGTPEKPVGTVHLAVADGTGAALRHLRLRGVRQEIKDRSATLALALLREHLLGLAMG